MPKIKMPTSSPSLDMTPMVDLAFLLVTFFMLTAQFRPEEVAAIDTPASQSLTEVPKEDIIFISIDSTGRVFWDFKEGKTKQLGMRAAVLDYMISKYPDVKFSQEQKDKFVKLSAIGVPFDKLPEFLSQKNGDQRKAYNTQFNGIPVDSTDNQLREWLYATSSNYWSLAERSPTVVLKADGNVDYTVVNKVVKTFQMKGININRFKMVTDLEK